MTQFCSWTTIYLSWMTECCSWKTVAEHDHQNQPINTELPNDQYIKGGTSLIHGEQEISWRIYVKSVDQ